MFLIYLESLLYLSPQWIMSSGNNCSKKGCLNIISKQVKFSNQQRKILARIYPCQIPTPAFKEGFRWQFGLQLFLSSLLSKRPQSLKLLLRSTGDTKSPENSVHGAIIEQLDLQNVEVGTDGLRSVTETIVWNRVKALKKERRTMLAVTC